MHRIDIKPLSINQPQDPKYKEQLFVWFSKLDLPKVDPTKPLYLFLEFGIGSRMDASNCVKRFEDCLTDYLDINDRHVTGIYLRKTIVAKGDEYICFNVFPYEYDLMDCIRTENNNYGRTGGC